MVGQSHLKTDLRNLFMRMNECLLALEDVAAREREAVQLLDAEALMELLELRCQCHEELQRLEERGRALMRKQGLSEPLPMEAFIDLYIAEDAGELKALRRELCQRLVRLEQTNEDNCLRLRAANDVIEGILQHIGIKKPAATYSPGGMR